MKKHHITGTSSVQIAASIEAAVSRGDLVPGRRLPTVRQLALDLGVSATTVSAAYRQLRLRGLVVADGRRGTSVRPEPALRTPVAAAIPRGVRDLSTGNPDPALLPRLGPVLSRIDPAAHLYGDEHELPELRALARRNLEADGISAAHLTVTSGALDGLERVLCAQLRPGDRIAVEDPGFSNVLDLAAALGLEVVPVGLDGAGVTPQGLADALEAGVSAVVITPRSQNPTGAALDADRVRALRRVLRRHPDTLLVEDDHGGAVSGAPAHTLVAGRRARWAVIRSVSKTHGPDLRLAILAGDSETLARVEGRQRIGLRWVSHLLQRVVFSLWSDPADAKRLRRAASAYARRRNALLRALHAHGIEAFGRSGLNVWIPVPEEARVVQGLLAAGWAVAAGERFRVRSGPAVRVTTACLEPAAAPRLARALAECLDPGGRSSLP